MVIILTVGVLLMCGTEANPVPRQQSGIPFSAKTVADFEKDPTIRDWILLQYRADVKQSTSKFNSAVWADYRSGFGATTSDWYWAGLEKMHQLTSKPGTRWELAMNFVATDAKNGGGAIITYDSFKVADEMSWYKVEFGKPSTDPNSRSTRDITELLYNDGMFFTTKDHDVDRHNSLNCATHDNGAWWHRGCRYVCPNCKEDRVYNGLLIKKTVMAMRNVG